MKHGLTQAAEAVFAFVQQLVQRHPKYITASLTALLVGGTGATFAVASLGPDASSLPVKTVVESVQPLSIPLQVDALQAQTLQLFRSDITRSTDTAETLLKRLGVFDAEAAAFLRSDSTTQQALLGRAGRNVTVEATASNALQKLTARWSPEDDGMFKRLTISKTANGYVSRVETLPMVASPHLAGGIISSSLFAATDDASIPDSVAVQLAEIFSGDIDFRRALRKGDRFSVVYETLQGDGEPLRAGRVLSAEFVNDGKKHQAMWFQDPTNGKQASESTATTKGNYFALDGQSLHRAFLSSPVAFSRISSGFSMRFHPILNKWRAHLGTDFAATTGTPARTVGDGVVEFAGVQNGYGNVVFVKHRNNSETVYAHLSKLLVQRGQNVSQGQTIGLVGATGWATGPHLHFEVRVGGVQRDPMSIARQSESIPVAAAAKPAFNRAAEQVRSQLLAAAQLLPGSAQ